MSIALIPRELPRKTAQVVSGGDGLRHIRCFSGRRVIAQVRGGGLYLHRYDDGLPDVIEETLTLESSGVTGCALRGRPCGSLDLYYCRSQAVYHRVSRDEGATWTAGAAVSGFTGYRLVEMHHDGSRGLLAVYDGVWKCSVGSVVADGSAWEWGPPASMTAAAARKWGTLRRLADGAWLFAWTDSAGTPRVSRCQNLDAAASGAWSVVASAPAGYGQATMHPAQALLGVPVYHTSGRRWDVLAGLFTADGSLMLSSPHGLGAANAAMGGLLMRPDGVWEMALVPTGSSTPVIRRCVALQADGSGTWA